MCVCVREREREEQMEGLLTSLFPSRHLKPSQVDAFYHGDFAMIAECASFAYLFPPSMCGTGHG